VICHGRVRVLRLTETRVLAQRRKLSIDINKTRGHYSCLSYPPLAEKRDRLKKQAVSRSRCTVTAICTPPQANRRTPPSHFLIHHHTSQDVAFSCSQQQFKLFIFQHGSPSTTLRNTRNPSPCRPSLRL
jgi:hypothetical protein